LKETIAVYRDFLTSNKSEIVHEEKWGIKQLAYPIAKKTSGIYHLFEYKADPELVDRLELNFRRDENVIRFLTVKLDKYAIEYNDKKRQGLVGPNKKVKAEDQGEAGTEAATEETEAENKS